MRAYVGKRRRGAEASAEAEPPQHVLLSCVDEPDKLVEVDARILEPFGCRLYNRLRYDEPAVCSSTGRPYWRCGMSKAMLFTLVRSLEHGQLSLGRGVSVSEALSTLEFEGISFTPPDHLRCIKAMLKPPKAGVAFEKREERVVDVVARAAEQTSNAIVCWPRLEAALDAALSGGSSMGSATPSRVWTRLAPKPRFHAEKGQDGPLSLARRWPSWACKTLAAMGMVQQRLEQEGVLDARIRDEPSFQALADAVLASPHGPFFAAEFDVSRSTHAAKRECMRAERFASELRSVLLSSVATIPTGPVGPGFRDPPPAPVAKEAVVFARACFVLAETLFTQAPSPASIFGGSCLDTQGRSAERRVLTAALQTRGVKVLAFADSEEKSAPRPLYFPPQWVSDDAPPLASAGGPAILLDFSAVR